MNTVFYMLRSEFEADDSYTGSQVMSVILKTIKVWAMFYTGVNRKSVDTQSTFWVKIHQIDPVASVSLLRKGSI